LSPSALSRHIDWGDVTEHLLAGNGPIFLGTISI
jgi:hypothetical protein